MSTTTPTTIISRAANFVTVSSVALADGSNGSYTAGADGRFFYNEDFTGFNFRAGTAPLNQVFQKLADTPELGPAEAIYVGSTAIDRWLPGFLLPGSRRA